MIESVGRTSTFLLVVAVIGLAAAARWRQGGVVLAASPNAPQASAGTLAPRPARTAPATLVAEDELERAQPSRAGADWTASSQAQWELARVQASTRIEAPVGKRPLARPIPPHAAAAVAEGLDDEADHALRDPSLATRRPYGEVAWLDACTLRLVDGMPSRSGWTQVELRLGARDGGGFDATLAVFSLRDGSSVLEPWRMLDAELVLDRPLRACSGASDASGRAGESLVARYSLRGHDARGRERTLAGLVELTTP